MKKAESLQHAKQQSQHLIIQVDKQRKVNMNLVHKTKAGYIKKSNQVCNMTKNSSRLTQDYIGNTEQKQVGSRFRMAAMRPVLTPMG